MINCLECQITIQKLVEAGILSLPNVKFLSLIIVVSDWNYHVLF